MIAISSAMIPTKIAPSRKITVVIRAVSPASPTKRVRAMTPFSGSCQASGGAALGPRLLGGLGLGREDVAAVVGRLDRLRGAAGLQRRELRLDLGLGAQRVELAGDVV